MSPFSKCLVKDPEELVSESLKGLVYLNPDLALDTKNKVVSVKQISKTNVHVLCGGGSGHEPSHASYVGGGMLSAAVCGNIFASPNSRQVTAALEKLEDGKGTLMVVKNYTGDVLNFGIAKERWLAQRDRKNVKMVIVGDDVSVGREQGKLTGRRGLAGTVLVYKIAGALASQGASLSQVHAMAQYIADRCATMGVGLDHCHIPGSEKNTGLNELGVDEVELGMGIHNEPGYRRQKLSNLSDLTSQILEIITSSKDSDRSFVPFKDQSDTKGQADQVILLVNNLGSLSQLEMAAVTKCAASWLMNKGITVVRVVAGTLMTSLNMPGFSISVVLLPTKNENVTIDCQDEEAFKFNGDDIVNLLDAPTTCLGWPTCFKGDPNTEVLLDKKIPATREASENANTETEKDEKIATSSDPKLFVNAIKAACEALIAATPEITKYDTIAGDGDCGYTLKAGATGVLALIQDGRINGSDVPKDLLQISEVVNEKMGGTSGGLYSIFFNALAVGIKANVQEEGQKCMVDANTWAKGLDQALTTLYKYTRARSPSRTLIDPLSAFILTLTLTPTDFSSAVEAAKGSAEATMYLDAKAGRAAYVDRSKVKDSEVPDAGAWGVWKILEAIEKTV
ncbi:uncharacterized protein MELLADRAFT_50347 [Melampsora larici-populina 98AG31]|uniref:Dihydroxyacetone kinase n=1 Tax=Melampsora larici-populina (strain 98AG31 / pathotype 3-4-7) TaxID=747676 RepID=F4S418_MELLP|nr:uncharacterized protein MELLADRAFT_50347 [Melampsora larici-populina 98AG31]EGG00640.1 hypothetical protein MELLADRAFT_50347 [Melampsora larici-populina 98AG31]